MERSMQQYIFANGYKVFGGTTAEWAAHDDPLYYRELGLEYTDDGRVLMKAGIKTDDDSPTPWSQLPYIYGKQGDKGDRGDKGDSGNSPEFEWDGTSIRFKNPDGTWGVWVDLKGPKGDAPDFAGSAYLILDDREYTDEEVKAAVAALDLPDGTICSVWFGTPGEDDDGSDTIRYIQPYNRRIILTESGDFTPPVTTWAKVTCIGGGGAGGSAGARPTRNEYTGGIGGAQGGTTQFGSLLSALGGAGGGGGGSNGCGGGGASGDVVTNYIRLTAGETIACIVGAGAPRTPFNTVVGILCGTNGVGNGAGYGGGSDQGGGGAAGASNGHCLSYFVTKDETRDTYGIGGSGGRNGTGYGGGGGGGVATCTNVSNLRRGSAMDGAEYGGMSHMPRQADDAYGGAGGNGAIFIDFFDPNL